MTSSPHSLQARGSAGQPRRVPAVTLRGVTKHFTDGTSLTEALGGVDLMVARGEFLSLIGPSGCGKSTLLRIIAGLIPPTTGDVIVAGKRVTEPVRSVGLMFQRPVLLPWRTVRANVMVPLEVLFGRHPRNALLADQLLEMVGLKDFARHYPGQLSLGMQQRVSLCRSLVTNPALLLMDEPFSGLDEITRETMGLELLRIWEGHSTTIVFVTHSVAEAILLSDRIAILTDRPAKTRAVVPVELPRPRRLEMLASGEAGELSAVIRKQIGDAATL
jgi:NitT/TauT family transport system ATP-binding protein